MLAVKSNQSVPERFIRVLGRNLLFRLNLELKLKYSNQNQDFSFSFFQNNPLFVVTMEFQILTQSTLVKPIVLNSLNIC